jgi:hypothetical protein
MYLKKRDPSKSMFYQVVTLIKCSRPLESMGCGSKETTFEGNHARSRLIDFRARLQMLDEFSYHTSQFPLKTCAFQQISNFHFITSSESINFYLGFLAAFVFGEADFYKIESRQTEDYTMAYTQLTTAQA